jgi:hypothetical protein
MNIPQLLPVVRQPGVLEYSAWERKTERYLNGMQDYIHRAIENMPPTPGFLVVVDEKRMLDAFYKYVYRTSANRYRSYTIIE